MAQADIFVVHRVKARSALLEERSLEPMGQLSYFLPMPEGTAGIGLGIDNGTGGYIQCIQMLSSTTSLMKIIFLLYPDQVQH